MFHPSLSCLSYTTLSQTTVVERNLLKWEHLREVWDDLHRGWCIQYTLRHLPPRLLGSGWPHFVSRLLGPAGKWKDQSPMPEVYECLVDLHVHYFTTHRAVYVCQNEEMVGLAYFSCCCFCLGATSTCAEG